MSRNLNLLGGSTVTYNVTVEEARYMLDIPNKSTSATFILNKDNWVDNQQVLTIAGLEESGYAYIVAAAPQSSKAYSAAGIIMQDISTEDTAVFIAETIPVVNLTGYILKIQEG